MRFDCYQHEEIYNLLKKAVKSINGGALVLHLIIESNEKYYLSQQSIDDALYSFEIQDTDVNDLFGEFLFHTSFIKC